eukprot:TRINITY_DN102946_c0_g1_i1.p2 TRINITY_DN102946_c0_g1~~TRINITY_DN102946_c0_g1_i1.p2  ORF type:complete len:154 (+),score=15.49 TRINITY_DN102946_c0_g1_i1:2-463(+)
MVKKYGNRLVIHEGGGSLSEQVYIFHNASIVIGGHGAGLANLMFARQSAVVIEFPGRFFYRHTSYMYLSTAFNLQYYTIPHMPQDGLEDFTMSNSVVTDIMDTISFAASKLPPHMRLGDEEPVPTSKPEPGKASGAGPKDPLPGHLDNLNLVG